MSTQVKGNILIVDDTPDNLRLLARLLTAAGYKVRPAPGGGHALATIEKEAPDLILLDIMMPGMDGYQVCKTIKSKKATRDIPVIFLSALDLLDNKMKGFEVGGVDYITKPFHEGEVILRVETHLKIRNLQQKLQAETARFKTLAEATFEGILIHADGYLIDANPEAARLLNCPRDQLIGTALKDLLPQYIYSSVVSAQTAPFEGVLEKKGSNKNDARIFVEIRTKVLQQTEQQVFVTAIRDLTSQKRMEREKLQLQHENTALKESIKYRYKFGEMIGRSPAMQMVYNLISKAAASSFPVVIYGESGTGKELAAKTIHNNGAASNAPFVSVNCGAVTDSLFEREFFGHRKGTFTGAIKDEPGFFDAAQNGTLFLDEIAELPLAMQVKLLRVLESGEYTPVGDVTAKTAKTRVIAATNKDLRELVNLGKFREDLFYRIQVIEIFIPPLRNRREDIRLLVEYILTMHNADDKLADLPAELREMLYHYNWPGNVRELMNTIQRYLATDFVHTPGSTQHKTEEQPSVGSSLKNAVESLEKKMIAKALQQTKWHRGETAEMLQIPRRSLLRKIQKYDLTEE